MDALLDAAEKDSWTVKDASQKFSRLFNEALIAPQVVTKRGQEKVVVIDLEQLELITGHKETLYDVISAMKPIPELDDLYKKQSKYKRRDVRTMYPEPDIT